MATDPTYKSFLRRFVFRKHVLRKAKHRARYQWRKATKDPLRYLVGLFEPGHVRTVFDVGANIGFMSHLFRQQFPAATVHAFEPNPAVFETLQRSYAADPQVVTHQLGVADKSGTLPFNLGKNTGTSSFLEPTAYHASHQASKRVGTVEVPVTTLDDFAAANAITRIGVVKLDIEGFELKALEGARRLLADHAIDAIYSEVNIVPSYEGQPLFHELTAFLQQHGMHLFNFDDFVMQESAIGQAIIGNAIYLSARFREELSRRFGAEQCGW